MSTVALQRRIVGLLLRRRYPVRERELVRQFGVEGNDVPAALVALIRRGYVEAIKSSLSRRAVVEYRLASVSRDELKAFAEGR